MKVSEFIENYKNAGDKESYLQNSITTKYVKYSDKIADCNRIVKATTEIDGLYKVNSPAQFMIFATTLISRYTDIEMGDNMLEFFEGLDEYDLINGIISVIPEREYSSYNTILTMCNEDYYSNNRELVSYIETKVSALQISADTLLEALQKYVPQNVDIEES